MLTLCNLAQECQVYQHIKQGKLQKGPFNLVDVMEI